MDELQARCGASSTPIFPIPTHVLGLTLSPSLADLVFTTAVSSKKCPISHPTLENEAGGPPDFLRHFRHQGGHLVLSVDFF